MQEMAHLLCATVGNRVCLQLNVRTGRACALLQTPFKSALANPMQRTLLCFGIFWPALTFSLCSDVDPVMSDEHNRPRAAVRDVNKPALLMPRLHLLLQSCRHHEGWREHESFGQACGGGVPAFIASGRAI